jgi:hypothetical protein
MTLGVNQHPKLCKKSQLRQAKVLHRSVIIAPLESVGHEVGSYCIRCATLGTHPARVQIITVLETIPERTEGAAKANS